MFNRQLIPNIAEAMTDTPVILLNGARQTGKSTLMQSLASRPTTTSSIANKSGRHYLTLDDPEVYAAAVSNPHGFIAAHAGAMLIDEVQRAPELFLAIKHAVDKNRTPGRFLLTGSANVLLLPRLSESLAGRMEILTLRPLSQMELAQVNRVNKPIISGQNLIDVWFSDYSQSNHLTTYLPVDRADYVQRLLVGGYPEVVSRGSPKRRSAWFDSYLNTVLQRDIRDLAQIDAVLQMPRLLEAIAHRTTGTLNLADVSRTLGLPQTSLKRYLTLMETVYLIEPLQAWTHRDSHRAQKASKYYLNDSGLFAHVMGITQASMSAANPQLSAVTGLNGALVETFVQSELRKHLSWAETSAQLMHYRTSTGVEVDFVLEDKAGNVIGIEVKSSLTVQQNDFKGLRHLQALLGDKFIRGIVLHPGGQALQWDEKMSSIPMSCFWTI